MSTIELLFDVVCPYAYVAALRIDALARRWGAEVVFSPVLLGGILRAHGSEVDPNRAHAPARQRQTRLDIVRTAALHDVPLVLPEQHPRRTLDAMRLVIAAGPSRHRELGLALFDAYWRQGLDVARRDVLDPIARAHGIDPAAIDRADVKDELRARTEAAVARGVLGVPSFAVGERLVWGQDRLAFVGAALGAALGDLAAAPDRWRTAVGEPATLTFFHDFASPFSYLAATQIDRVAAAAGVSVQWRPILLGALFRDIGTPDVPLATMHPAKQAWVGRDLEAWAAGWGVPFRFRSAFPIRTVLPLRVAIAEPAATLPIYRACWAEDLAVDDANVLGDVLTRAGLPAAELLARAASPEIKERLRAHTAAAEAAGACGVPSYLVERAGEPAILLWGQDRLGMLAATLGGFRPA